MHLLFSLLQFASNQHRLGSGLFVEMTHNQDSFGSQGVLTTQAQIVSQGPVERMPPQLVPVEPITIVTPEPMSIALLASGLLVGLKLRTKK